MAVMEDVMILDVTETVLLEMVETVSVRPVSVEKNPLLMEMVEAQMDET